MPTLLRKPVVSISVRVWIGCQKMFAMPGVLILAFISAMILSHVMPGRHWPGGLKVTTVSNIESGAGSVDDSACPALPKTVWTSGILLSCRFCIWRTFVVSLIDMPGTAVGMKSIVPSFSGGMNSGQSLFERIIVHAIASPAE